MDYLTVGAVAEQLGTTPRYVYAGLKEGRLRGVKFAGSWRFKKEWVEAWVEGRPLPHAPQGISQADAAAHTRRMLQLKRERRAS